MILPFPDLNFLRCLRRLQKVIFHPYKTAFVRSPVTVLFDEGLCDVIQQQLYYAVAKQWDNHTVYELCWEPEVCGDGRIALGIDDDRLYIGLTVSRREWRSRKKSDRLRGETYLAPFQTRPADDPGYKYWETIKKIAQERWADENKAK